MMKQFVAEKSGKVFDCRQLDKLGVPIKNLVADSRLVQSGDTFLAVVGARVDARKLIPQAISAGANAVIWESGDFSWNTSWQVPSLAIEGLREKAGFVADCVYGHPSRQLNIVGFTGTNGKTSCSHWFVQAMVALHNKTTVMGTLGNGYLDKLEPTANTTPDPVLLQKNFAKFVKKGVTYVGMEVSSHGIEQGRLNGTMLSVAVLTNLSRDHLDYHENMDAYAASKARLFFWPDLKCAVLNLDDVLGVELFQQLAQKQIQVIGYGFKKNAVEGRAIGRSGMLYGCNLKADLHGLTLEIEYQGAWEKLKVDLIGKFNASNLLAVLAALLACGIPFTDAVNALRFVKPISGRMEKFGGGNLPTVIVDYAHTPDALEKVLSTLCEILHATPFKSKRAKKVGRLFCVIGCGGERDQGKRELIGEVATRFADEVIFTSDNPRSEDPRNIIRDMIGDMNVNRLQIEINRELAIYQAISNALAGDIVLIAGKGHETYQEINGQKIPFSDVLLVQQILSELPVKKRGQA